MGVMMPTLSSIAAPASSEGPLIFRIVSPLGFASQGDDVSEPKSASRTLLSTSKRRRKWWWVGMPIDTLHPRTERSILNQAGIYWRTR